MASKFSCIQNLISCCLGTIEMNSTSLQGQGVITSWLWGDGRTKIIMYTLSHHKWNFKKEIFLNVHTFMNFRGLKRCISAQSTLKNIPSHPRIFFSRERGGRMWHLKMMWGRYTQYPTHVHAYAPHAFYSIIHAFICATILKAGYE